MKASELRTNNWVKLAPGAIVQVDSIFKTGIEFNNGFIMLDEVYGIPLTPEILEKCGFEKKGQNKDIFIAYDIQDIYRIYLEKGKYSLWILDRDYEETAYCRLTDLLYLHQLQNLCHALTGQELQITL